MSNDKMTDKLLSQIGATANYVTEQEAEKLTTLCKEIDVILLSLKKLRMTRNSLLHELDKKPGNAVKQTKLDKVFEAMALYHGKVTQKKQKATAIIQKIKWRKEKKRGI